MLGIEPYLFFFEPTSPFISIFQPSLISGIGSRMHLQLQQPEIFCIKNVLLNLIQMCGRNCYYRYLLSIISITSFVQYNRPGLPVLFWRVVFRNRTGIIHFRLMKMVSFQFKTAKNQFYLLMMLILNKTRLNLRSQNRTRKTAVGWR